MLLVNFIMMVVAVCLSEGDIDSVTKKAIHTSSQLEQYINEGYKILSLVPHVV